MWKVAVVIAILSISGAMPISEHLHGSFGFQSLPMLASRIRLPLVVTALVAACASHAQDPAKRDLTKGNTMYVVPYSHLDTQWRWAYPQVIREYIWNTLVDNFKLIDKYPNYIFNFSGSRRYEMMKEYYPEQFAKLKGYVAAGRWFPCGSSVDEGDANVPSAESLIRHVLYGNRYFRKEFGVASQEFMLPDCFGFPYALPSILAHCGLKGFSTQKLTWGSAVGIPFPVGVWTGPDGESVVAALNPGAYAGDVAEDLSQNTSWLARIQKTGKTSGAFVDYHYYGTGDIGGAPRESSVEWVEKSINGSGPVSVISSKADDMFRALTAQQIAKLPRYQGELLLTEHSAGSVTSQAYMKRWNRKNEFLAGAAEQASVAAYAFGKLPYPAERLYSAWDLVLGSQMHDMLPGTSIPKAYEYCWSDYLLAANIFQNIEKDAVGAVSSEMDTRAKGSAVLVFNPLSIARTDVVEATIPDPGRRFSIRAVGPDGIAVPTQVEPLAPGKVKILFQAKAPSSGFAVYDLQKVAAGSTKDIPLKVSLTALENERLRVTINTSGDISSVFDKVNNREVLKAPSRLELQYHNPRSFPAWNMDWDDAKLPPREVVGGPASFKLVERGPVRIAVEIDRLANGSRFKQIVRLTRGGDKVEVINKIDWQTRERALKASFPLTSGNPQATYDLQVGTVKRGNNDPKKYEVPQHLWFDLSNGKGGAAILNDSKFGSDKPNDDTVRLTMIYTPGVRGGYEDQATQDFGRHEIVYAIAPHAGDWRKAGIPWTAKRLNQPLQAFSVPSHPGSRGKVLSLASSSSGQVEIQALKKAEESGRIIVRLRELTGNPANNVRVKLFEPILGGEEVNGQEIPIGKANVGGGALVTSLQPYSLKSFSLRLAPPKSTKAKSLAANLSYDTDVASTDQAPADGEFSNGFALAGERLPRTLNLGGVGFALGSSANGAKNALSARGQSIPLPSGYKRVYILASADTDCDTQIGLGRTTKPWRVQGYSGYIGQWDNRYWAVDPGPNFTRYGDTMNGLAPGWVKGAEVAWYASHRHTSKGNTFYDFTYLFKYGFDVPAGANSIKLPNDPRIKVFSISLSNDEMDTVQPLAPLFDTLEDHRTTGSAVISTVSAKLDDVTSVKITPPLYWHAGRIHYTTDGTRPTLASPSYTGPFFLYSPTTVKVVQFDPSGRPGPIAEAHLNVNDITAPRVISASVVKELAQAKLLFTERLAKDAAEDVGNYKLPGARITSAILSPNGRSVELLFDQPISATGPVKIDYSGIADAAPRPNRGSGSATAAEKRAVFTSPALEPKTQRAFNNVEGLPVRGSDPWTVNLFTKIDSQPADRTIIAGFGRSTDGRTGTGRYFTKFSQGINFWASNRDVGTTVQLDTGKWQMLTATYDGAVLRVYKNGTLIGSREVELEDDVAQVRVMPLDAWERQRRYEGEVTDLTVWDIDLSPTAIRKLWESKRLP